MQTKVCFLKDMQLFSTVNTVPQQVPHKPHELQIHRETYFHKNVFIRSFMSFCISKATPKLPFQSSTRLPIFCLKCFAQ